MPQKWSRFDLLRKPRLLPCWRTCTPVSRSGVPQRIVESVVEKACWTGGAHGISFWPWAMAERMRCSLGRSLLSPFMIISTQRCERETSFAWMWDANGSTTKVIWAARCRFRVITATTNAKRGMFSSPHIMPESQLCVRGSRSIRSMKRGARNSCDTAAR